jgi:tetratricopeptide (TPR) repeat protein
MKPLDVIRYLWAAHPRVVQRKATLAQIMEMIGQEVSKPTAHRMLKQEHRNDPEIHTFLTKPDRLRAFEAALGLPGLFTLPDRAAIDAFVRGESLDASAGSGLESFSGTKAPSPHDLIPQETDALGALAGIINRPSQSHLRGALMPWAASLWSGAAFLASNLVYAEGLGERCNQLFLLRPGQPDMPYEAQLGRLLDILGIDGIKPDWPKQLIEHLQSTRSLLVLANAEYLTQETRLRISLKVNRLVEAALDGDCPSGKFPAILSVGAATDPRLTAPANRLLNKLSDQLIVPQPERYPVFRRLVDQYLRRRNLSEAAAGGSRLKRARWRYESEPDRELYPINIRMRAYFTSNTENAAYFDPTEGFAALAGRGDLPPEIASYKADMEAYLDRLDLNRDLERTKSQNCLYVLRLLSCATHWITTEGLNLLTAEYSGGLARKITAEPLEQALRKLNGAVRNVSASAPGSEAEPQRAFVVGLGLKALVQDRWRAGSKLDRVRRSLAHWRIARKLYEDQDSKEKLGSEFPYGPQWGRTRLFFLSECIRHLVRACDQVEPFEAVTDYRTAPRSELPLSPTMEQSGCDPYQVWSFCFGHLYWRELNANRTSSPTRALAKRNGAYQMALELLQLLSQDEEMGRPHWALDRSHRADFRQECAFALLDVGKIDQAADLFIELDEAPEPDEPYNRVISSKLNRALVLTLSGRPDEAQSFINKAEAILASRPPEQVSARTRLSLERRAKGRRAQLHLLRGELKKAQTVYEELQESAPLKGEMAHCYIHTLCGLADQRMDGDPKPLLEKAFRVCARNRAEALREAMHHEALGFRVAEAAILRRLTHSTEVASAILDDVCDDILTYGCAERSYLSFMLEAGRTLLERGEHRRAYASYLRPCLERAASRGQFYEAHDAACDAKRALDELIETRAHQSDSDWAAGHRRALEIERTHRHIDHPRQRRSARSTHLDPLYGYEAELSTELLEKMVNVGFLEKERTKIVAIIEAETPEDIDKTYRLLERL